MSGHGFGRPTPGTDALIIGAGSAGCVLANRLSANPARSVRLLEAGNRVRDPDMRRPELWPFIQGRSYDWGFRTTPQPALAGRNLEWPRGRGLGGSSLLHAMAHMRGCRADFAAWIETTGDARWSWEGLLPYFDGMESIEGGPLAVIHPGPDLVNPIVTSYLEGWESLGVARISDHNRGEMLGATSNSLSIANGKRVTTADAWLKPARARPNLTVTPGATVHRLVIDGEHVRGAICEINGALETVYADTVVLAAGSLADPLLLMRSGVGDPAILAAAGVMTTVESLELGCNLHDHLLGASNLYRTTRTVPPSKLQLSESMTYLQAHDLTITVGQPDIVVGCSVFPTVSEMYAPSLDVAPGEGFSLFFGVTNPTSRGSLFITGPDIGDAPIINPNYLTTNHDRALFRVALEHARQLGHTDTLKQWGAEEVLPGPSVTTADEIDTFIARAAITHHHPVGTLRMGKDDNAPVTPDLAFRGLSGLYVADASVIPSITSGPVHAAVLAIAESFAASFTSSRDR